jgi:hypothetical protein
MTKNVMAVRCRELSVGDENEKVKTDEEYKIWHVS